ncbi:MAG: hypothetical protein HQL69_03265 [Magnetococcales bacterium]|nr:hypothetical protein [Magnetococcales bacterium]
MQKVANFLATKSDQKTAVNLLTTLENNFYEHFLYEETLMVKSQVHNVKAHMRDHADFLIFFATNSRIMLYKNQIDIFSKIIKKYSEHISKFDMAVAKQIKAAISQQESKNGSPVDREQQLDDYKKFFQFSDL